MFLQYLMHQALFPPVFNKITENHIKTSEDILNASSIFFNIFIYLAPWVLVFGTQDLRSLLLLVGSLVLGCRISSLRHADS